MADEEGEDVEEGESKEEGEEEENEFLEAKNRTKIDIREREDIATLDFTRFEYTSLSTAKVPLYRFSFISTSLKKSGVLMNF